MPSPLLVITTCPNQQQAESLAKGLVEQKLAACVQLKAINSIYQWQGELQQDDEIQLMIKTDQAHYPALESYIQQQHSYAVPEIIALEISRGSADYLNWLKQELLD